jgi:GTPase SAR1 family protein
LPNEADPFQKGLIITDDIAIDPILDFNSYRDAIVNIVRNSYPKFTIGIFGDWGTGKTTLMNSIDKVFQKDKDLVTVRFETWRYEREEQFALFPLLKTIAFALPSEEKYSDLKQKLKRSARNLIRKTPDFLTSLVSKFVTPEVGEVTKEIFDSFRKEFNSKVELLAEVDRDTLYFDGFEDIKNEIIRIRKNNPAFRIVVFIDDLDRCSPTKTLEVLESIKVFLGMEGFIYIVGISHDIVTKLIDIEYEKSGVKGEQYIRKMIQIPITLPKWDNQDIIKLVKDFAKKGITHERYRKAIDENIDLISTAIENNPREIKRFLNNFIVAYEIFSPGNKIVAKELLVIQAIQLRYGKFYDQLIKSDDHFRIELKKYVEMKDEIRLRTLDSKEVKENENYDLRTRRVLADFKEDLELWSFLRKNLDTLGSIKDWSIYRRASEVSIEPFTRVTSTRNFNYRDDDGRRWMATSLEIAGHRENLVYPIITPSGRIVTPTKGRHWRYSEEMLQQLIKDNKIWFGRNGDIPQLKRYYEEEPLKKESNG